ncbi:MAG: hypothetical protein U0838_07990 [Chloroflexota bacterium]
MTKKQSSAKPAVCQNPDHAYVHCILPLGHPGHDMPDKHGRLGSRCVAKIAPTFVQPPGRGRPREYCPYRRDGTDVEKRDGRAEMSPCAKHANDRWMKQDGVLVPKAHTTYESPLGPTRSYREVAGEIARLAGEAEVAKGSPIRTAMLSEHPVEPRRAALRLDGAPRDRSTRTSVEQFVPHGNGVGAPSVTSRVYGAEIGAPDSISRGAAAANDRWGDGPLSAHERIGVMDESIEERERRELREAMDLMPPGRRAEVMHLIEQGEWDLAQSRALGWREQQIAKARRGAPIRGRFGEVAPVRSTVPNRRWQLDRARPTVASLVNPRLRRRFRLGNPGTGRGATTHDSGGSK